MLNYYLHDESDTIFVADSDAEFPPGQCIQTIGAAYECSFQELQQRLLQNHMKFIFRKLGQYSVDLEI